MHAYICMFLHFVYVCIYAYVYMQVYVYLYTSMFTYVHAFHQFCSRVMRSTLAKPEVCVPLPKPSLWPSVFGNSRTSKGKGWSTERDMLAGKNNRCPHLERFVVGGVPSCAETNAWLGEKNEGLACLGPAGSLGSGVKWQRPSPEGVPTPARCAKVILHL